MSKINLTLTDGEVNNYYQIGGETRKERMVAERTSLAKMPELALMRGAAEFLGHSRFGASQILVKDLVGLPAAFELAVERRITEDKMDANLQQYAGEVMLKTIAANVNPEDYENLEFLSQDEYINTLPID